MAWLQLRVLSRYPEFAEEILLASGALSVSLVDAGDDPVLEPAPEATPLWKHTRVLGLFDTTVDLDAVKAALHSQLPDGSELELDEQRIEDQDWVRVWLKDCPPLKFGERLWVCPHEKRIDEAGTVSLLLDPGLAFGTGTHPSTALCLDWIARADVSGARVLDYGCGSGILGIAALKLGAAHCTAYDIDPQAITATRDNAEQNHVAERLVAIAADERFVPSAFDIAFANILARPLIDLAPVLTASLRSGGVLVLAGLLERQASEVKAAYASAFDFEDDHVREGWTRLIGRCSRDSSLAA